MAKIVDGTYNLVGDVVRAFRSPGVTTDNIKAFQTILNEVKIGGISGKDALDASSAINPIFAGITNKANENAAFLTLILTIISLFVTIYGSISSDASSAQQHADAQQQLAATQSLQEVQQKIFEQLANMPPPGRKPKHEGRSEGSVSLKPKAGASKDEGRRDFSADRRATTEGACPPKKKKVKPRNYQHHH